MSLNKVQIRGHNVVAVNCGLLCCVELKSLSVDVVLMVL